MTGKRLKLTSFGLVLILMTSPAFAAGSLHVMRVPAPQETQKIQYSCVYPRVEGITSEARQQRLNVRFREKALSARYAAELEARMNPAAAPAGRYGFEVKRNGGGILSIVLTDSLSLNGHERVRREGVTVNTVSGETLKLGDLFFDRTDYREILSEKVKKQILRRGLDSNLLHEFRGVESDQPFYLTNDALVIILGQEYFSGGMKVQEFSLTLQSLEGSLKPQLAA